MLLGVIAQMGRMRGGGGPAPEPDPHFANVILLLHLDGADGSGVFPDSSPIGHTVARVSSAQIDTDQSKFGGASLTLVLGGYLSINDNDHFVWGTGALTIELFVRFNAISGTQCFVGQYNGAIAQRGWYFQYNTASGRLEFVLHENASTFNALTADWEPAEDVWYHLCVERTAGGLITIYVDGAIVGQDTQTVVNGSNTTADIGIGNLPGFTRGVNGWIDEVRVTKGVARYGGVAFTPPSAPFPDS